MSDSGMEFVELRKVEHEPGRGPYVAMMRFPRLPWHVSLWRRLEMWWSR